MAIRSLVSCLCTMMLFATTSAKAVDIEKCAMVANGKAEVISFSAKQNDGTLVTLEGILAVPEGTGIHPVVVMLPGGGGLVTPFCYGAWVDRFTDWGFAALIVESTTARDAAGRNLSEYSFLDQANHGRGAISALATRPNIDRTRIAIWGFSRGGLTAIELASNNGQDVGRFRAIVAAAPYCPAAVTNPHTPLLVLIGAEDEVLSASSCIAYAAKLRDANEFEFLLLEGAKHVFWMDLPAAKLSAQRIQSFLKENL